MTVGQFLENKFTWLLDEVEIRGQVVRFGDKNNRSGGEFDVAPDPNYGHLISSFRGNNPLQWEPMGASGVMHCETYLPDEAQMSRVEPWATPDKPAVPFSAADRSGVSRELMVGDVVRVVGRWVIDHHPEYCAKCEGFTPSEPTRCHYGGFPAFLHVGQVHTELHPFHWDEMRLVDAKYPDIDDVTLSLAAPIHEEQYWEGTWYSRGGGFWSPNWYAGVERKVFIAGDGSNFHPTMSANITLDGPSIDPGTMERLGAQVKLLECVETVLVNGTGLPIDAVRTITRAPEQIRVAASVTAAGGLKADVFDPTNNRSVFQAKYALQWTLVGSRITCINRPQSGDPDQRIGSIGGLLNDGTPWQISLDEAISIVDNGGSFFVDHPRAARTGIAVAVSSSGRRHLVATPDAHLPNGLWSLPECSWIN